MGKARKNQEDRNKYWTSDQVRSPRGKQLLNGQQKQKGKKQKCGTNCQDTRNYQESHKM